MRMCVAIFVSGVLTFSAAGAVAAQGEQPPAPGPRIQIFMPVASRPMILPPLYVGLAVLQAYDGYTTTRGIRLGARETNPFVGGLADRPVLFWSVKAASTAVSIYFAERLWREHHPTEAIMMMIVADSVMAVVAARNASLLASRR